MKTVEKCVENVDRKCHSQEVIGFYKIYNENILLRYIVLAGFGIKVVFFFFLPLLLTFHTITITVNEKKIYICRPNRRVLAVPKFHLRSSYFAHIIPC